MVVSIFAVMAFLSGCSSDQPVITKSTMSKCIESYGFIPVNAGDADTTVAYRNETEDLMIALTVYKGNVIPLEKTDALRVVSAGCEL